MHHRYHRLQIGIILLPVMALSACTRSANTVMTPLPSEPPSTATLALAPTATPTTTSPVPATVTATVTTASTAAPSPTASLQAASATATKAVPSTEDACGNALVTRLRVNGYAYVNPEPPLPNNLRENAGEDSPLIGDIQPGQAMKLLAGPKCVSGSFWWQVQTFETDLTGWTAEGDGQNYWLVPCASESECVSQ